MALAGKLQWVVALVAIAAATIGVAASSGAAGDVIDDITPW